jgi:hypothetical protein
MCATLRAEVLTRLDDEFGRGQVFGVINLLNTFKVRANWSAEYLLEQIESQRSALEAAYACLRQGAPARVPPAPPPLAPAVHAPIAELLARRDTLNAAISALLAWLQAQGDALDAATARDTLAPLRQAMRREVDLELKWAPRPLFAEMSSGKED